MLDDKSSAECVSHPDNAERENRLVVAAALLRFALVHARIGRQRLNPIARALSLWRFQGKR